MDYKCVTTIKELQEYIGDDKIVSFDFETAPIDKYRDADKAALDPHKAVIVGISLSVAEGTAVYIPLNHRVGANAENSKEIVGWLSQAVFTNCCILKIAHNLSFEAMFLYALGVVVQMPCYDTICASQLTLKSNTEFRNLSDSGLKTLVPELYDVEMPKFEEVTGGRHFDELDPQDAETVRYACADSDYTLRLYHTFNNWFDRFLPKHRFMVEQIESPTAVYVGLMKYNGLLVNKELMLKKQAEAVQKLTKLREDIAFIIGDVPIGENASTSAFKNYLYKDLGLPILKTTAKYQEAADDETMILLTDWCNENRPELAPLFELIQEFRKWGKIKSTYIDGYLQHINTATGRIHANMMQLGAESGRFSCRNPNLQNQVSSGHVNVRDFIIATENHSLIELDYSQIEARLAAYLSRDDKLFSVFKEKRDLHAMTTAAVFKITLEEAMNKKNANYKHKRTVAKTTFFGFMYGIYAKSLMRNLKIAAGIEATVEDCKSFLLGLTLHYEILSKWQKVTINHAKVRCYAETAFGRRRYLPSIISQDFIKRGNAERSALNHGVQGLAADILKLSMTRLIATLPQYLKPVLTVHDSLVFECPDDMIDDAVSIIKQAMETTPPIDDFDVDIVAEVSVGKSYGSMKEI